MINIQPFAKTSEQRKCVFARFYVKKRIAEKK